MNSVQRFCLEFVSSEFHNTGGTSLAHPLQATANAFGAAGGDPRAKRASHFMSANEGPAEIAAKTSGVNLGGKRKDDSANFTNNESIPWPDPLVSAQLTNCMICNLKSPIF